MCHVDPSFQEGKCLQHFCHRNIRTWRSKMQHDMRASVVLFTAQRACQPPNHTFGSYAICLHLLICQGCGCWGRVEWHYDDVWGGRWIHIIFFWQCALVWGPSLDFLKMRTLILVGIASTSVFPPFLLLLLLVLLFLLLFLLLLLLLLLPLLLLLLILHFDFFVFALFYYQNHSKKNYWVSFVFFYPRVSMPFFIDNFKPMLWLLCISYGFINNILLHHMCICVHSTALCSINLVVPIIAIFNLTP